MSRGRRRISAQTSALQRDPDAAARASSRSAPVKERKKKSFSPAPACVVALRPSLGLALGLALVAALLYARTAAPSATFVDSGELILAARDAGVAHPPGMPVWVAAAHVATRLPLGNVARRVNLSSAVFAALAAAVLVWIAREAWLGTGAAPVPEPPARVRLDVLALVALALPALLLASGHTLWAYAGVAEVYALHALLLGVWLALTLRARRDAGPGWLLGATLACVAALGVHHVTALLVVPSVALLLFPARRELFTSRRLLILAGVGALGLGAVYAWLPWAAARQVGLNWGDPSSLERFFDHVSARQYRAFLTPSLAGARDELGAFLRLSVREHGAWVGAAVWALAFWGAWRLWRRDRALMLALGACLACSLGYGLLYIVSDDKDAYYLPARLAVALFAGAGAAHLAERAAGGGAWRRAALAAGLFALPAVAAHTHFAQLDRSADRLAEGYFTELTSGLARDGLLLTADWQFYSPALYYRDVERRRADLALVDVALLRRVWYFDALRRDHPALLAAARVEVDAFLEDLRGWERDPGAYERERLLNARINERFHAAAVALVRAQHAAGRRAYATLDVALRVGSPDPDLAAALEQAFALVPVGLAFELLPREELGAAGEARARADGQAIELRGAGLWGGPRALAPDDVAALKVRPVYLAMQTNRGAYLALRGDRDGALRALRRALEWQPGYEPARALLRRLDMPQ